MYWSVVIFLYFWLLGCMVYVCVSLKCCNINIIKVIVLLFNDRIYLLLMIYWILFVLEKKGENWFFNLEINRIIVFLLFLLFCVVEDKCSIILNYWRCMYVF